MKPYFKIQTSSNLTHRSFKSQYTVYTRLRKPSHHLRRTTILVFQSLLSVPLGCCNEINLCLWLPVSGKFLAIDHSLSPRRTLGPWRRWGWEQLVLLDTDISAIFIMVSDFQVFLMFQKLALWILSVPRETVVSCFKVILPSKTFLIFGISPVEHFSNFNNLPTIIMVLDLSTYHLDLLDTFLYIGYLFTQINILSKEASHHHSECSFSILAVNRSTY